MTKQHRFVKIIFQSNPHKNVRHPIIIVVATLKRSEHASVESVAAFANMTVDRSGVMNVGLELGG